MMKCKSDQVWIKGNRERPRPRDETSAVIGKQCGFDAPDQKREAAAMAWARVDHRR
jgi:hypothetical protein